MTQVADILRRIVEQRRKRVGSKGGAVHDSGTELPARLECPVGEAFLESIRSADERAVIAEIKLGSPRLGSLVGRVDPEAQARLYAENGAVALSVVVEPDFFYGSYELLSRCQRASGLPALAKDFIVHPVQLEWARQSGAAAILLIAALHSSQELLDLARRARQLDLVPLVECHSGADLQRLAEGRWELVGINNRDLRTFEVDLEQSIRLLPDLPGAAITVAESGIRSPEDVARLSAAGFDAFLIGETLLLAEDPASELQGLVRSGTES